MALTPRRTRHGKVSPPRSPWASPQAARQAVVASCKKRFFALFGVEFTDEMHRRWRENFRRLQSEDSDAREVFTGGRFYRSRAVMVLRKHGLDPQVATVVDLAGHASTLGTLFLHVKEPNPRSSPSIRDLREEFRPIRYDDHRAWVVSRFEMLWCALIGTQRRMRWGQPRQEPRYLTDHELAVISVLMDPTVVVLYKGKIQDDANSPPTEGQLLDRERHAIGDKREIFGELRSKAEKDAQAPCRCRPELPSF